ncbi:MAG: phosphoenolpyruvate--protein phosphotransferase [Acidimicrobiales bacterium]
MIVSHSATLAAGVAELARGMGADEVAIATAGGLDAPDRPLGTDAALVLRAIEEVWSDDGVLVLMDLGSAVLSAEMALDFLADERRARVVLCDAPLVEGAVAGVVAARLGQPLARVAEEARRGLAPKTAHLGVPEGASPPGEPPTTIEADHEIVLRVSNPHGLHARPAARLVEAAGHLDAEVTVENLTGGRGPVPARSLTAVATLGVRQGDEIRVRARGPEAQAAVTAVAELAGRHFDDPPTEVVAPPGVPATPTTSAPPTGPPATGPPPPGTVLAGLAASPGVVAGEARHFHRLDLEVPRQPAADPDAALEALERALAAAADDTRRRRDQVAATGAGYEAGIFDAHLLLLDDPALLEPARRAIRDESRTAAAAWADAAGRLQAEWETIDDEYLRERAADLRSVAEQVLAHLLGAERTGSAMVDPGILVARDLSPADTAALDPALVLGLAIAAGGPTSHSAILARSLGIPAVVRLGEAVLAVAETTPLLLDGEAGTVAVSPSDGAVRAADRRRARRSRRIEEARSRARQPAATRDGVVIEVAANLGTPDEVAQAVTCGADAVGLFRTELLFLTATEPPGEDDQERAYREVAEALAGRPLTARTLDAGSDKPLPFLAQPPEANPALGVRGLRLGLARPEVLATQLRALLRVAADHPVRIMFPMVTTSDELSAARLLVEEARGELARQGVRLPEVVEVGIMVEVPAAALAARALAADASFFSIGTNDLAQYTLAADRTNERVAGLADGLHPAVLELIARTAEAGMGSGRWTGVCGEVASDPSAVPILLGLGVRELSATPASIPSIKDAVRAVDLTGAQALAAEALHLGSATAVRALALRS